MMFSTPILGQEVMKFHGVQGFPCSLMLWMNMLVPSLYITSMELRALRVVIIFNEEYRKRFGILMTNKFTRTDADFEDDSSPGDSYSLLLGLTASCSSLKTSLKWAKRLSNLEDNKKNDHNKYTKSGTQLRKGDALGSSTTNTAINSPDGESSMNSSTSWQRSIEIINNPIMNAAHPEHVERFLCFESYNFLCEVLENSKISTTDAVAH
eukprot:13198-Heterococcus_DN1.PRE.1